MTRLDIIVEARAWIGTPFLHQGALRGIGCDCSGLILGVMAALGSAAAAELLLPPHRAYHLQPDPRQLRDGLERYCLPVTLEEEQPADILLMRFAGEPQHVGFLSRRDPDSIIHSYAGMGRVTEHAMGNVWRRRVVGAYAIREVAA